MLSIETKYDFFFFLQNIYSCLYFFVYIFLKTQSLRSLLSKQQQFKLLYISREILLIYQPILSRRFTILIMVFTNSVQADQDPENLLGPIYIISCNGDSKHQYPKFKKPHTIRKV